MASTIDICNLALAHLGEIPSISSIDPPEGSAHAEKCERFYPVARDAALEMRNWSFALKRVQLAQVPDNATQWAYKYALPSDIIRPVAIPVPGYAFTADFLPWAGGSNRPNSADFITEGDYLYTNADDAQLLYLFRLTDVTKFTPLFVNSVAWLLASYLAGAITRDMDIKQWCYQMFERELGLSAQSMANGSQTTNHHVPSWISNR